MNPYPLGYPETAGSDESMAPSNVTPSNQDNAGDGGGYDGQPEEHWPSHGPYPPAPDLSQPAPAPASEEAVTIIFKDGRPAEQIHNYILTRSTLIVGDRQRREIPTDQLDLAATAKVNQDAGVEFSLPDATR